MIAADTNVIVRLFISDDTGQAAVAKHIFSTEQVWVSRTVLLETAWVLGKTYRVDQKAILEACTDLMGMANVRIESESAIVAALELAAHGMQIADAIHVACRPAGTEFVTFDEVLIKRARRAGVRQVSRPKM
jgi:predicted nucleic-acid-binding protein